VTAATDRSARRPGPQGLAVESTPPFISPSFWLVSAATAAPAGAAVRWDPAAAGQARATEDAAWEAVSRSTDRDAALACPRANSTPW